ncbi:hypothetical protein ACUY1T_06195 [Billgrantia sp. Q4P2]|uniref:hypothetical protein n=1 Tax=Billgrantia sp. Q4P2 TaxID=3463857 RepID=UPI004055ECE2
MTFSRQLFHIFSTTLIPAALAIALPLTSTASETRTIPDLNFDVDIEELSLRDRELSESTEELCKDFGAEGCEELYSRCLESSLPNSCFHRAVLFYSMDLLTCEGDDTTICINERAQYEDRLSDFANDYASEPGIGRAALNMCTPFFGVTINHPGLIEIKEKLDSVMKGLGDYMDYKGFYLCVQEQFLEMSKSTISR